jgi:metallo-beta-lactamase family protein
MRFRLTPNGHILGSACVSLACEGREILFSGDLGRPNDLVMRAPQPVPPADVLLLESTYGDRLHGADGAGAKLAEVVNRTAARGGVVVIPAFAVGRAQTIMYHLHLLKAQGKIGPVPVYLNSPMAADATALYRRHLGELRLSAEQVREMCAGVTLVNTPEESRQINERSGPMVIISASGMATGGRVLFHLERFAPQPRNTVLFVGFQAGGTRGAAMLGGAGEIKIHGQYVPVRAEIARIDNLSSHADYAEILDWLGGFSKPPKQVYVVHGEPGAADAMRRHIQEKLGWPCAVPEYLQTVQVP